MECNDAFQLTQGQDIRIHEIHKRDNNHQTKKRNQSILHNKRGRRIRRRFGPPLSPALVPPVPFFQQTMGRFHRSVLRFPPPNTVLVFLGCFFLHSLSNSFTFYFVRRITHQTSSQAKQLNLFHSRGYLFACSLLLTTYTALLYCQL